MQSLNELRVGRFLGRYELLMPVAQGGMAAVWAARLRGTRGFQRVVAIKTILPSLSDDSRFEQMFLDETALAARVRHPNVVQVLDLGEENGLLYQVMEWIDGEALNVFLRELPSEATGLPFSIGARILIGSCDGLHAAHETTDDAGNPVGLVHRDISPQNILVTRDGVPKVVDFGVAKSSALTGAQTATGTLKGKPGYMAPEQVQGGPIDRRADIFSLGVLLYIVTTARHPFRGSNDMATLHNIVSGDSLVPPSALIDNYPPTIEDVVLTALAHKPENRFSTAAEMARALEAAVPGVNKVGDAEVAAFMRNLLADKLDTRADALRKALADADARASLNPGPTVTLPPNHPSVMTLQGIVTTTVPGASGSSTPTSHPPGAPTISSAFPGRSFGPEFTDPLLLQQRVSVVSDSPSRKILGVVLGMVIGLIVVVVVGIALLSKWDTRGEQVTGANNEPPTPNSANAVITEQTDAHSDTSNEQQAVSPTPSDIASSDITADSLPSAHKPVAKATPGGTTKTPVKSAKNTSPATSAQTPSATSAQTPPAASTSPTQSTIPNVPRISDPGF